ncbi:MAG: 2-oxo-4-hydroxy-4-carboxy-5-ureidoimidazoline decarboxylase [Trueperaceae bacterium]
MLQELNHLNQSSFTEKLGGIFEHSPWVADGTWYKRPFASVAELHEAMCDDVEHAPEEQQLKLIRAHPDLAGKAALAGDLTESSKLEQAGAGLDRLTPEEYRHFHALNDAYTAKFAFPFILAVKGHTKETILQAFEERLPNSLEVEKARALEEIYKIARFRLEALLTADS